jgi:UDP-N-acetylmuramoylalanine-D-glutamate ligase
MVLLATGCASFDKFKGFAERGEKFTEQVRRLDEKK